MTRPDTYQDSCSDGADGSDLPEPNEQPLAEHLYELCPVCLGKVENDEWSSSWCPTCEMAFYRWTYADEAARVKSWSHDSR